jgi:protein YIPF5/7
MSQQRPYEGFSYPTAFQSGGGGDTYFSAAQSTPPASTAPAAVGGGVSNTGLTRRSTQHTSVSNTNINAATGAHNSASPTSAVPVTVPLHAVASTNNAQFPGSYGYFHGHGNSIEVNSGYNSDVGSSVSNPRNVSGGGGSGYPVLTTGASSAARTADVVVRAIGSASGGPLLHTAAGGGGAFHTGGSDDRAGSTANSTRSSGSVRPPVAPPTFLPSRPFIQMPPPATGSSLNGGGGHQHSQQQPYMVPMPSSMPHTDQQNGSDPLGGSTPPENSAGPRLPHVVSPSAAGPRTPSMALGDYAHGYGSGAGSPASGRGGGGPSSAAFFGRMIAQVFPTFDDGDATGGSVPRERPIHQLRFGNPEDDLPLLEELGVFPRHILDKARAVLNPFKVMSVEAAKDTDLAGPILFALSLALLLSLRGKIQFSAIYGLFVLGVVFFKILLSLMQPKGAGAPLQWVVSTVGYGLLPTVLLAVVRTMCSWLLTRRSLLPLTLLMILWSAWCGSALVAKGLGMEEQRYLVLYPMLLFYAAFDALTVF